jgi:RNA-directed DNA polymerase
MKESYKVGPSQPLTFLGHGMESSGGKGRLTLARGDSRFNGSKTRIVDARTERFDFLGYSFRGENHWPREKSLKNLRDAIRARTRRTTGDSLQCVVASVNPVVQGWFAYFQHSTYHNVFASVDGYVRRRLRSILRKRMKRKGISRKPDHQLWPNVFFAKHGLFSLAAAHALVVQSSRR